MNNFINNFVVGIDVSSKSSVITILMPGGETYGKKFNITNDLKGFTKLLTTLKEIEKEFSKRPEIFMESTGIYHLLFSIILIKIIIDVISLIQFILRTFQNKVYERLKLIKLIH